MAGAYLGMMGLSSKQAVGAAIGVEGVKGVTQPRGIASSKITANAQKSINASNQNFIREQRDWTADKYEKYGVPFIPGLTTSGGGSPLPKHTQALGNRNITTQVPGLTPQANAPLNSVTGSMGIPLLR